MDNRSHFLHFTELAFAILVMSSSGVLGKYIELPVPMIIWMRCVLGAGAVYLFLRFRGDETFVGRGKDFKLLLVSSIFLGLHWLTYFWSLKFSNVAIGMLSLFTYPVITAIIEPLFFKAKFLWPDMVVAALAFVGVFFLVPDFNLNNGVTLGVALGILSATLYSFRNILLKKTISNHSGNVLMFNQLVIIAIGLLPFMFFYSPGEQIKGITSGWHAILLLSFYTTALGHTLLVRSFRHFSVTTVSIFTCITPLLGVFQAYLFINEKPTEQVMIGGSIILFSVVIESIRSIRKF